MVSAYIEENLGIAKVQQALNLGVQFDLLLQMSCHGLHLSSPPDNPTKEAQSTERQGEVQYNSEITVRF